MKILGIETSCDETAVAVVEDGTKVLSNVVYSQIPLHHFTGGVVPEVAAREHVVKIVPVIKEALKQAGVKITGNELLKGIDAIAVTRGPGLLSSLITGVCAASTLSLVSKKKLIPVNHIAGHIYANWLAPDEENKEINFPVMVLTVSGGHNELVLMKKHADFNLIGESLDDAAGEAFDKVARLLGLGYPGGPHVARVAEMGNALRFQLPRVFMGKDNFDFSFSGLKTAVLNVVTKEFESNGRLREEFIQDVAACFQDSVCSVLSDKLLMAGDKYKVKEVHIAGGVSANKRLRQMLEEKSAGKYYFDHKGKKVNLKSVPVLRYAKNISLCTDNAAMIAGAAYFLFKNDPSAYRRSFNVLADPNLNMYD